MGSHFGVGEFATHFRTSCGECHVHWGLTDLAFEIPMAILAANFPRCRQGRHIRGAQLGLCWDLQHDLPGSGQGGCGANLFREGGKGVTRLRNLLP